VTIDAGQGGLFRISVDGCSTSLPVLIHGGLTIKGTGQSDVAVGAPYAHTGLILGKDLHITSGAGEDHVTFNQTRVEGSVSIAAGDGANAVDATDLVVVKNLAITNGKNATGTDATTFTNLAVNGSVSIPNGDGDTSTKIQRNAAGSSAILGNVTVTNGAGLDRTVISDENIGGNVTVNNGQGDATGLAGTTQIYNDLNTGARSVIGGNVSITYVTGGGSSVDSLEDVEIGGNVVFNHGAGGLAMAFDGFRIAQPVLIHGGLTVKGTGASEVDIGFGMKQSGLIVGKDVSITGGSGDDTFNARGLVVEGRTGVLLGDGGNAVSIDDSAFSRAFTLTTGKGVDAINLETTPGTVGPTIFGGAVAIKLGHGADTLTREGTADPNQAIYFYGAFTVDTGHDPGDAVYQNFSREFYAFLNAP
jgi:hypothetical protein